tara:strand:- start:37862 stop:38395 length:534 start_codon:yes stop_codon:yes gene_type:complete
MTIPEKILQGRWGSKKLIMYSNMNFQEEEYILLYNPPKYSYFPVRILKIEDEGALVKVLSNSTEKFFFKYYFENYGYRRPFISSDLIYKCGFHKDDRGLIYRNGDIIIVESYLGKVEAKTDKFDNTEFLRHLDIETIFLGFKILNQKDLKVYLSLLSGSPLDTTFENFKKVNGTITD